MRVEHWVIIGVVTWLLVSIPIGIGIGKLISRNKLPKLSVPLFRDIQAAAARRFAMARATTVVRGAVRDAQHTGAMMLEPVNFTLVVVDTHGNEQVVYPDGLADVDASLDYSHELEVLWPFLPLGDLLVVRALVRINGVESIVDQMNVTPQELPLLQAVLAVQGYRPVLGRTVDGTRYRFSPSLSDWWYPHDRDRPE